MAELTREQVIENFKKIDNALKGIRSDIAGLKEKVSALESELGKRESGDDSGDDDDLFE